MVRPSCTRTALQPRGEPHSAWSHQNESHTATGSENGTSAETVGNRLGDSSGNSSSCPESAHEWWGNSITSQDLADMGVHETSRTTRRTVPECRMERRPAQATDRSSEGHPERPRRSSRQFGVNNEGSGDMLLQGRHHAATHSSASAMMRNGRRDLRGLNSTFRIRWLTGQRYRTTSASRRESISVGIHQYRRRRSSRAGRTRSTARRSHSVGPTWFGFAMPIRVRGRKGRLRGCLRPTTAWQNVPSPDDDASRLRGGREDYVVATHGLAGAEVSWTHR